MQNQARPLYGMRVERRVYHQTRALHGLHLQRAVRDKEGSVHSLLLRHRNQDQKGSLHGLPPGLHHQVQNTDTMCAAKSRVHGDALCSTHRLQTSPSDGVLPADDLQNAEMRFVYQLRLGDSDWQRIH